MGTTNTVMHAICLTLIFLSLSINLSFTSAQSCISETFSSNKLYSTCQPLPELAATLHWTYHAENGTADVAYRASQVQSGWTAWAINPTGPYMLGSNAFLAFQDSTTSKVTIISTVLSESNGYTPIIRDENLTFAVYDRAAEYSNGSYTIYVTIQLPGNATSQTIVWQAGTGFKNGLPYGHLTAGPNLQSTTSLDFLSGQSVPTQAPGVDSRLRRKNIHGLLNAIGWGILLPLGVIIARHMRSLDGPAWFHAHVACQITGYLIGAVGFGLGLKLGSESKGITYHSHRIIGIFLFGLATLQLLALLTRPNPKHQYRIYWNYYHYLVGYFVIILSIINIFKGFSILNPDIKWKHAYSAVIATLGCVVLILEICKWTVCRKRKSNATQNGMKGSNGFNLMAPQPA